MVATMMEVDLEKAVDLHQRFTNLPHSDSSSGSGSCSCSDGPSGESGDENEVEGEEGEEEEEEEEEEEKVDPGPFRYNRRVLLASLPCFPLLLALAGDVMLTLVSVVAVFIMVLAYSGQGRRAAITFLLVFLPSTVYIFVSALPLMWLSWWNGCLILSINFYVVLLGGWGLLQFSSFRTEETTACLVIEQFLFTLHPINCAALITWMASTVVPISAAPLVFLATCFVLLQLFLTPVMSSFRLRPTSDEDLHVVQQPVRLLLLLLLCILPPALSCLIAVFSASSPGPLSLPFLVQFIFTICTSVFLATLVSIRELFEFTGWSYQVALYARWVSGAGAVSLIYPVLRLYGLGSHFLPWLPVALAAFASLGFVLAHRRHKAMAVLVMLGLCVLLLLWMLQLPWGLTFHLAGGLLSLNGFYLLLCANFLLCLLCAYTASHGSREALGLLLLLQSAVLTVCELSLQSAGLYGLALLEVTGLLASYTLHRLFVASKLSRQAAVLGTTVQACKVTFHLLQQVARRDQVRPWHFGTLFLFLNIFLDLLVYEPRQDGKSREGVRVGTLLGTLLLNVQPLVSTLCFYLWREEPSPADLLGMWLCLSGMLVFLYTLTHQDACRTTRQLPPVLAGLGLTILVLQPQMALTPFAMFQWSEIATLVVLVALLSTISVPLPLRYNLTLALLLAVCPAIRLYLLVTGRVGLVPLLLLWGGCSALLLLALFYSQAEVMQEPLERSILTTVCVLAAVEAGLVVLGAVSREEGERWAAMPALKAVLATQLPACLVLKMFAVKKGPALLPVSMSQKAPPFPLVPLLSNCLTALSLLLLLALGPGHGLTFDLWCAGACAVLLLLQNDGVTLTGLRRENMETPTVMGALGVLLLATVYRCDIWAAHRVLLLLRSLLEICLVLATVPIYIVLWGVLWLREVLDDKIVVFLLPLNLFLYLTASSYTAWLLATAGLGLGGWLMLFHLPLVPYEVERAHR